MGGVHLLGVGATSFSALECSAHHLAYEAFAAALADAGLTSRDVGAVTVATDCGGNDGTVVRELGVRAASRLPPVWVSGAAALHAGWHAVATGARQVIVCVGRSCAHPGRQTSQPLEALAAAAARYMRSSGATEHHFAQVVAKNRRHAACNPRAVLTTPIDSAAVLASDVLAWPLRRLMLAPRSSGAAAVVLASNEIDRPRGARAPRVLSSVLVGDADVNPVSATARAARLAYEASGVGPEDLDCAETDDPAAPGEVAAYEALQFAPEGAGPELVQSGFTALGGVLPVNTSGGAFAYGHGSGAAAIAQLCELAWQLRGEAGRRQVPGARAGLALARAEERAAVSLTIVSRG